MPEPNDFAQYPKLANREPEFRALVAGFLPQLANLSPNHKRQLALFKAIELTNALVQIWEQENSPQRLGPEKAAQSFQIIRALLRDRQINLAGEVVSFKAPEVKALIDQGAQTFHAGKRDPEQWQRALAFSTAQYIELHPYLAEGLHQFHQHFQTLYSPGVIAEVTARFITPYGVH